VSWELGGLARDITIATFGNPLIYTPTGGASRTTNGAGAPLHGTYRSSTEEADETGQAILVERPNLYVHVANYLPDKIQRGDRFEIAHDAFVGIVQEVRLDGEGGATVFLQRSA
jgi:hypothetical protein